MSEKIVLSIPHTGTRTLTELFDCGFMHTFVRTYNDYPLYKVILKRSFVISPLRDPRKVWESWVNRWEAQKGDAPLEYFSQQWGLLSMFADELPIFFFPVDKLLPDKVGHVEGDHPYYDPAIYPQPNWNYIYSLPMVEYYYDAPEDLVVLSPGVDRQHLALRAPQGSVGCELGVARGDLTERFMELEHFSHFHAVDRWSDDAHPEQEYNEVVERLQHHDQLSIHRADVIEWLNQQPDESLGFIYIDCYAHTGQDDGSILHAAWPKLAKGGLFSGDDYNKYRWPKTYEAVNRFAAHVGCPVEVSADHLITSGLLRNAYDGSPSWYFFK